MSGAAPLDERIARAVADRIGCRVVQGYGLTETSPVTHLPPEGPDMDAKPGSVGPPLPGTECRALDSDSGEELPPGEDGEIVIRGPQVMLGYLRDQAATATAIDRDGCFIRATLGHVDAEGWLFIIDRLKELIKVRGLQVAPAELEAVLQAHPAVADAAVVPSPDRRGGEVPKAFVVLREEADLDELRAYVADRVARHKRIRRIEAVEEIPRSPREDPPPRARREGARGGRCGERPMSAGGRLVPLTGAGWEDDAPGIRARAVDGVDGRRFAIVEYGPGAAREDWCLDGHYGLVLEGEIEYRFEDGSPPLRIAAGEALWLVGGGPAHQGTTSPPARRRCS